MRNAAAAATTCDMHTHRRVRRNASTLWITLRMQSIQLRRASTVFCQCYLTLLRTLRRSRFMPFGNKSQGRTACAVCAFVTTLRYSRLTRPASACSYHSANADFSSSMLEDGETMDEDEEMKDDKKSTDRRRRCRQNARDRNLDRMARLVALKNNRPSRASLQSQMPVP
jgi:hypothetical protein